MANTAFSTLLPDVQGLVPSCPASVLVNGLRQAAIDFCRRTGAYKYRPAALNVVALTANYTFALPTETEIQGYHFVQYSGAEITFWDWDYVTVQDPAFPTLTGTPAHYTYQAVTGALYLVPVPDTSVTSGLRSSLILRPVVTATGLDADLVIRYRETLINGAVWRVSMMAKEVWNDMDRAKLRGRMFLNGCSDAAGEADSDFAGQPARVMIRKFR